MLPKTQSTQDKASETLYPITLSNFQLSKANSFTSIKSSLNVTRATGDAKKNRFPLLIKRFLRRSLIALASLRVSPSATTSTTNSVAPTDISVSASIKLFLLSCYYITAFCSLFLLIIYINHFASILQQNSNGSSKYKSASVPVLGQMDLLPSAILIATQTNETTTRPASNRTRLKRSIRENEEVLPGNRLRPTPTAPSRLPKIHSNDVLGKQSELSSHQAVELPHISSAKSTMKVSLPNSNRNTDSQTEFLRRQVTSYSLNNRGTHVNSSVHNDRTSNVWIPIVVPNKPQQTSNLQVRPSTNTVKSTKQTTPRLTTPRQTTPRIPAYTTEVTAAESIRVQPHLPYHPIIEYQRHIPGVNLFHPFNQQDPIGKWRRPRFNEPQIRSKLYKRVLLCDKTMVSLDYVRNFEPNFENHQYESDFLDDNFIDLDDRFDTLDHHTGYTSASNTIKKYSSPNMVKESNKTRNTLSTASSDISLDAHRLERRSYLTDEDPLVKCDMWDLEKGLKNRKPPKEILQMAVKADFDTVRDAINRCRQLTEKTLPPDDEYRDGIEIMSTEDLASLFSMKRGLLPGTKWCGLGDQASTYNDLGSKHRIDVCCRAHDHCPIRLKPFRNDYGVLNIALYTKSHCDCDADFYRCLREVHSRTADMLGNLYFNVMKLQCLREERMKICREMKHFALGFERCVRYEESPVKTVFKFTTPPVAY